MAADPFRLFFKPGPPMNVGRKPTKQSNETRGSEAVASLERGQKAVFLSGPIRPMVHSV
jgi:hypothetical protein